MKLKKGDTVQVLSGKDRGKTGEIMRVLPKADKVIVAGVNIAKRHTKATRQNQQAGIIDKDVPMHASKVALLSPVDGKPTRIGYLIKQDGTKVRVCRRTGAEL